MQNNIKLAYSEIYTIINFLNEDLKNKIPTKLSVFFENEREKSYIPKIDENIPLEEQNLLEDTINLLAMLKLNYWCRDEEEKNELLMVLSENEKEYQTALGEKYTADNLFKKEIIAESEKVNIENKDCLIEYKKESLFTMITKKIKKIFIK